VLTYQTYGTGPTTALLVHGFLGAGRNLASLGRRLAAAHPELQVVLPDLRGHAASPPLAADSTLQALAEDLFDLAAAVGSTAPMHLIGHSLGGRVALAALGLRPERLASVALLDIGPSPVRSLGSGLQEVFECLMQAPVACQSRAEMRLYFTEAGVAPALADWVVMNGPVVDGAFSGRIDRVALQGLHRRSSAENLWPILEAWSRRAPRLPPVTVVRGGASVYVDDTDYARLAALGCRTATLPGAGHFVHVDAPAALMGWLI
jgi:esterase